MAKITGTRTIDQCYDCEHYKSKWSEYTSETPYGRETIMHSRSWCDLDEDVSVAGNDIPEYCPLFGKPKPKPIPNRIIKWYNKKTNGEISIERNGLTKIDFIQDEPGGKTFTVTIDQLEKILIKHFAKKEE